MDEDQTQDTEAGDFTVEIEGPGMSVVRQTDGATVAGVVRLLFAGENGNGLESMLVDKATADNGRAAGEGPPAEEPQISIGEFLDQVGASNNFQRIAAIALYHREHLGEQFVAQRDLPGWFERAGRSAPKNLSRDVREAIKRRLIAERTEEDGQLFVTGTGEEQLRSNGD